MTPAEPIPEQVARFLDANVESIEQLEILRILGEAPAKDWTSLDLAKEAQIQTTDIAGHLAALEQRGLIKTELREATVMCRYGPATQQIEAQMNDLLRFYKERPVTLIKAVYSRVNDRLKAFADSFRLRKEK